MACEVARAGPLAALDGEGRVLGLGAYDDDQLVQRHYGVGTTRTDMWDLPACDTSLYVAGAPNDTRRLEESAQPFRLRQWLFGSCVKATAPARTRDRLAEQLPDFLMRSLKGQTLEEAIFATFLSELRSLGRTEDPDLEAAIAAQLLARTTQHVEDAAGPANRPGLSVVATNGRVLVAAARGNEPLYYRLLEGDGVCSRCGLVGDEKPNTALVQDHRRRRSVVFANEPTKPDGWLRVPDGRAIAVGRALQLQTV